MKLKIDDKIEDFTFDTPFEKDVSLASFSKRTNEKTALVFLRYYGCTICQYDMHLIAKGYESIQKSGGQLAIVLQSSRELIAKEITKDTFPFDIICDPKQALYQKFEILPAVSMAKMADAKTVAKVAKATLAGYKHGEYEGEELQLPAIIIVDSSLVVQYAHYAKTASDMPSVEAIAKLMQ